MSKNNFNSKIRFNNSMSRSISRSTLLKFCSKKYFFNYYTGAIKLMDSNIWLDTLLLKGLTSLKMRIGSKFHGLMSEYLNTMFNNIDILENDYSIKKIHNKIIGDILDEMRSEFYISKIKDYSFYDKENKFGFSEHLYGQNIDDDFENGIQKISFFFNNFINSSLYIDIKKFFINKNKVFIEPKETNFDKMKFSINHIDSIKNVVLRAQPDFGVIVDKKENTKKKFIIYDWKTGANPDYHEDYISDQLKVYAYKMLLNIGLDMFDNVDIFCNEVFVASNIVCGGKIKFDDIEYIQSKIQKDIQNQQNYIVDGNIEKNTPLPSIYFKRTLDTNKCISCRFRKVCENIKKYENHSNSLFI